MACRFVSLAAMLLLPALATWQLAGPQANVELSPETTFVTKPRAEDGLPNFALALLERQAIGVTAENNAARLLWEAVGPVDVSWRQYDLLCKDLGVRKSTTGYLEDVAGAETRRKLQDWLASSRDAASLTTGKRSTTLEEQTDLLIKQACARPWSREELPTLRDWLARNEAKLDLIVEAAAKPRLFSPPPNILANPATPLVDVHLPHCQAARHAVRSLSARAMSRIAEGRIEAAWQDVLACWRYGALVGGGATMPEKLWGIALRARAREGTMSVLQANELSEALARQILDDLNQQTLSIGIADALGYSERLIYLDTTLRGTTNRLGGLDSSVLGDTNSALLTIDPNGALRLGNRWFDRIAKAAAIADRPQRREVMAEIHADLQKQFADTQSKFASGDQSSSENARAIGEALLFKTSIPSVMQTLMVADDRDEVNLLLARVAAAIAVHRETTGRSPGSLSELVPHLLTEVPRDPFGAGDLRYERRGDDGYVLYSLSKNEIDDGGTDFSGEIIKGEWIADNVVPIEDYDHSDFVIRMPRPWSPLSSRAGAPSDNPD